MENIYKNGYAKLSRLIMHEINLSCISKSIYALLMTFADKQNRAYPSVAYICKILGISKNTYHKHIKPLIDYGCISVNQIKNGREFSKNIYTININFEHTKFWYTKVKDTKKSTLIINTTNNNISNNSVFKGEKKEKGEKRKKSVFGDTLETFDFKGYERWYNSLTVEQRNEKRLNSPIVKLALLENANQK